MPEAPVDVDDYLAGLPERTAAAVAEVRSTIHRALPGVTEAISHAMPTFLLAGRAVVHVAGWARHVSLYPVPDPVPDDLARAMAPHLSGRSTLRLPLAAPLDRELVARVVTALADQALAELPPSGTPPEV